MSEALLLSVVATYPHPTALARRLRDSSAFTSLRRLEAAAASGANAARTGSPAGRSELTMTLAVQRLAALRANLWIEVHAVVSVSDTGRCPSAGNHLRGGPRYPAPLG